MRPATPDQQNYYFSDRVIEQLRQIPQHPLTVVEAPSGFGKTTAIREYLRGEFPQAACEWYTCLGEPAPMAWAGICGLFSRISSEAADGMKNLKVPAMDTLFYLKAHLKGLKCRKKTFLIIDNYHLVDFDMHRELISAFSLHESPNLHIIFITQQLDSRERFFVHNGSIHTIGASAFFFDREGVASLFRMEGFRLTEGELENVIKSTEGWVSAIRLQLINYKEAGSFVGLAGIERLVEASIWNRLLPAEKDFLLAISVFDSFTARQAAAMLENGAVPGDIEADLKASDFIRFLPDKRLFIIHGILLEYLRNRFYYYQPKEYQDRVWYKAGLASAAVGQYCLAARCLYRVGAFDALLSLPFTRQYLDTHKEEFEEALFTAIIQECPEEILCKHPTAMIVFAHHALLSGQYGLFEKLHGLLCVLAPGTTGLTQAAMRRLTGEIILLEAFGSFNDLAKMRRGYEAAGNILGAGPDITVNNMPWFSVFPTTMGLLWREPGRLDETLDAVDALKPIYRKLSQGQSAGLAYLVRGEALLTRGEDTEAEILCHKALYEARTYRQTNLCIYAELCLARVFILRGDAEGFIAAKENIQRYAEEQPDAPTRRMVDMCLSILSLLLGFKDEAAPWLYNLEDIRRTMYAQILPFAQILYLRLLLMDKRYNELYAVSQLALEALGNPDANIQYVMPQLYYLIFLAVAKHNCGDDRTAGRYLKEALDMALEDRVYLPFADHECMADLLAAPSMRAPLCEEAPAEGAAGGPPFGKNPSLSALLTLCKRQASGVSAVKRALLQRKSSLTPREREIALLARQRLSAKEIASKLYISEKTVKSTLGNVYGKLGIHSKSELALREF